MFRRLINDFILSLPPEVRFGGALLIFVAMVVLTIHGQKKDLALRKAENRVRTPLEKFKYVASILFVFGVLGFIVVSSAKGLFY